MRTFLMALMLFGAPGMAAAECTCTCNGGQAVPACTLASDIPPICQRICQPGLTQAIGTPSLVAPIATGNLMTSAAPTSTTSTDPNAAATAAAAGAAGLATPGASSGSITSMGGGLNVGAASVTGYR